MNSIKSLTIAISIHLFIAVILNYSFSFKDENDLAESFDHFVTVNLDHISFTSSHSRAQTKTTFKNRQLDKSEAKNHFYSQINSSTEIKISEEESLKNDNAGDGLTSISNSATTDTNFNTSGILDGDNEITFNELIREYRKPIYPRLAIKQNLEGVVRIEAFVHHSGKISKVLLLQSSGHNILDDAAINAVYLWHFKPTKTGYQFTKTIRFKLN